MFGLFKKAHTDEPWLADAASILQEMPVALVVTDPAGTVKYVNARACKTFGFKSSELLGLNVQQLIPTVVGQSALATVKSESQGRRKDGTIFPARLHMKSIGTSADPMSLLAVEDLTVEREAEHLRHQFLAMISHDLRSPISSVLGMVDLLGLGHFGELPGKANEALAFIVPVLRRVNKLITDLLLVEKLSSSTFQLSIVPTPIEDFIEPSMSSVSVDAEQRGITIRFDSPQIKDTHVLADCDRVVQVLINLLSNAVKYAPSDSIVSIRCELQDQFAKISVLDQGMGVPQHQQASIFEPYKQANPLADTASGGTGLGLAICKQLIEGHGGKIGVTSAEGQGSEFWFTLPAYEAR